MVVAMQPVLVGIAWYIVVIACPVVLLWSAVRLPRMAGRMRERWQARQRAKHKLRAQGPPLEKLAADLRRLRGELLYHPPTNNVRRAGLLMAYDSVLQDLCARLEIQTDLDSATTSFDREVERLRAESAVQEAGVSLEVPRRFDRPAQP